MRVSELEAKVRALSDQGFNITLDPLPSGALPKYDCGDFGVVLCESPDGLHSMAPVNGAIAHVLILDAGSVDKNLSRVHLMDKATHWVIPYRSLGGDILGAGMFGYLPGGRKGSEVESPPSRDPYAMVPSNSVAQKGLLALGWTVTDSKDGWAHMEPPRGARNSTLVVPDLPVPQGITIRELDLGDQDTLIVTAEDLDADMMEQLREQVDLAMEDPDFTILANFDIKCTVLRRGNPPLLTREDEVVVVQSGEQVAVALQGTGGVPYRIMSGHEFNGELPLINERLVMTTTLHRPT